METEPGLVAPEAQNDSMLEALREQRIAKAEELVRHGISPYPTGSFDKEPIAEVIERPVGHPARIAGRIMLLRVMGNITFGQLRDESGDMQFVLSKRNIDQNPGYKFWSRQLDIGDIIGIRGERLDTRAGEPSVDARELTLLAKALRPLPDKHGGLRDEEARLRERHLDILLNRDVRDMIRRKARFWASVREFLTERDFLEVQTPVLETTTGGADARPFVTHHNDLDIDVCLRISMGELWQKRLLVGGLEKVFEIGRQFRNEGQSRDHLNDYDQMEFYWAYADHRMGMELVEELFRVMARETFGTSRFQLNRGGLVHDIDLDEVWERYDYRETVERLTGIDVLEASVDDMADRLRELRVIVVGTLNRARVIDALWKYCRRSLTGPGFLVNHPAAVSPLAKRRNDNPLLVERFQVIVAGSELGNGYSELNDPRDQAARFAEQQLMRDAGDDEAQMPDPDFIEALEIGMPPACGFGMSERVFAFLMDKSVRECQIFPLVKPR